MWNYRVVKIDSEFNSGAYVIKEVYYNKYGEIWGISEEEIAPMGSTVDELQSDLTLMLNATYRPVLIEKEIQYAKPDFENE